MSLYSLLNEKRFVGCIDAREDCACFEKQAGCSMSLICRANDDGLYLALRLMNEEVPAAQFALPEQVRERILFWNGWASDEFLNSFDCNESPLYGLEAYAISIAADIAAVYPEYKVDYCGFPVHDEWAVREYAQAHCSNGWDWDAEFPLVSDQWSYNGKMKKLVASARSSACRVPPHGFVMRHDVDYGMSYFHFDPADTPYRWLGYADSWVVDETGGFPGWLVLQYKRLEIMNDWELYDHRGWDKPDIWNPSQYIQPFLFDALAIDVARWMKKPVPISASSRYVTGEILLDFIRRAH